MKLPSMKRFFSFVGWLIWLTITVAGTAAVIPFMLVMMADLGNEWLSMGTDLMEGFTK